MNIKKKRHMTRAQRRRRERLLYILTAVFASLCIFAVGWMVKTMRDSSAFNREGAWIIEDGDVVIAAPPVEEEPTSEPVPTEAPTEEPTPEPTEEPTPEPTEEPTPEPTPISIPTEMDDISDEVMDEDVEFDATEIVWTAEINSVLAEKAASLEVEAPASSKEPEPSQEPVSSEEPSASAKPATSAKPAVSEKPTASEKPAATEEPASQGITEPVTITITAAGDCTLGGDYNTDGHERFDKYAKEEGYDYFLKNVRHLFEDDDLTFVNLEGPLTKSTKARRGRIFNFKGNPEYAEILAGSSVEVAGLANNHAMDFSTKGLKQTAKNLAAAGVGPCGYKNVWTEEVKGVRITCMSVTEWDFTTEELTEMVQAQRESCDLLIVMIHWGEELLYKASKSQIKYGHALIDAGADLVLGSHSHVVGGVELYNGKYIAYGLGNFCFGGNYDPTDYDCMIFRQNFIVSPEGVEDNGIAIIPCSVSSKTGVNNYQPTPHTGNKATKVIKKIAKLSKGKLNLDDVIWDPMMADYLPAEMLGLATEEPTAEPSEEPSEAPTDDPADAPEATPAG